MKFRQLLWPPVKYAVLTVCGVLLYLLAAKHALTERGYFAIGGEGLLLLLPVIYGILSAVIRDWLKDLKARGRGLRKH